MSAATPTGTPGSALTLHEYPERLAVLRLPGGAEIPPWVESSSLMVVTATATETAVVCAGRSVPSKVPGDRGLVGFRLDTGESGTPAGPGVLLALLQPLSDAGASVHVVTTSATVWVLVPLTHLEPATEAWRRSGHTVQPAVPA